MNNTELVKEYFIVCTENIEIIFQDNTVNISNVCVKEYLERENMVRLKIHSGYINSTILDKHKDKSKIRKIIIHKNIINKQEIYNQEDCVRNEIEEFIFDECYIDKIIINDNWDDNYNIYFEISGRYINE
jgi:hypothetical protein